LGYGFDIHGGGMDLIFPHHENEIAQSEAASPESAPFAHLWMHNGFLNIDKEKMSTSMGNVVKPRDIYRRNDPEALRYVFLSVHYRGPLSFDIGHDEAGAATFPTVDEAERRVDYLYSTLERTAPFVDPAEPDERRKELTSYRQLIEKSAGRVLAALDDDLNTPVALAQLGELAKATNELCDMLQKRRKDVALVQEGERLARKAGETLIEGAKVMGLLGTPPAIYRERTKARRLAARGLSTSVIESKLEERAAARQNKDFARADELRAELDALSIDVFDSPAGSTYSVRV
jgi:cysteinyl-tRNA synthetase